MTKIAKILPIILLSFNAVAQNFGDFASAVFMGECTSSFFYNTTGSGVNCINPNCSILFNGHNFGTYIQNSGELYIGGAEIKTWKNPGGNVCGGTLHYRVYPTGSPAGAFSTFNIPFKVNCCFPAFCDGLGSCGGSDQKWSTEMLTPSIDLTTFAPGNWSVEVFFSYFGDDFSSGGCGMTKFITNGGLNYVADFTIIAGSGTSCTVLAAELNSLTSTCFDDYVLLDWDITVDAQTRFIALEKSVDGVNWSEFFRSEDYQTAELAPQTTFEDRSFPSSDVYYRLVEYETTGNVRYFDVTLNQCEYETENYSISTSIHGESFLIVRGNDFHAPVKIEVFDAAGKNVFQQEINHSGQESAFYKIDDVGLTNGVFIVRISRNDVVLDHIKCIR